MALQNTTSLLSVRHWGSRKRRNTWVRSRGNPMPGHRAPYLPVCFICKMGFTVRWTCFFYISNSVMGEKKCHSCKVLTNCFFLHFFRINLIFFRKCRQTVLSVASVFLSYNYLITYVSFFLMIEGNQCLFHKIEIPIVKPFTAWSSSKHTLYLFLASILAMTS